MMRGLSAALLHQITKNLPSRRTRKSIQLSAMWRLTLAGVVIPAIKQKKYLMVSVHSPWRRVCLFVPVVRVFQVVLAVRVVQVSR